MILRLARWMVAHRMGLALLLLAATAAAGYAARNVKFDFTPQSLFASNDDAVAFSEKAKATFGYEDSRFMVVLEATGPRDVLDAEVLTWEAESADRFLQIPRIVRVDAVATLKVPQLNFRDGLDVLPAPLIQDFPATRDTEERVRQQMERSKMVEGSLLSHDRRVGAMYVVFDPTARDVASMQSLVAAVRQSVESHPPPEGFRVHYCGLPGVRVSVVEDLEADQAFLFPLAGVMFLVTLGVIFRSIAGVLVPMLAVLAGLAWTVGIVAATGGEFNIVSNVLPILILIIGVSNSIHLVVRYSEESDQAGGDTREATVRTIAHMFWPCLLTLITAALGFLSLASARSRVLQMFGVHASVGMVCLYISVLITFAVLLPLWKTRRRNEPRSVHLSQIARITASGGDLVTARPKLVLVLGVALTAGSFFAARHLQVNSSITETYTHDHPQSQTVRLVEGSLGGLLPLEIVLTADRPGMFLDPAVYRKVAAVGAFARQQREVTSSQSYVDLFQEIHANFRHRDALRDVLPEDDEEGVRVIRQTYSQAEKAREAAHPESFLSEDGTQARILVRVRDVGTRRTLELIHRTEAELASLFPPGSGVTARQTGDAFLNAVAMDGFVRDLFSSLVTAAAAVFVLISLLFWSLRIGLIAALPNIAPLAITLGYMGLRDYDLNAGNVAVFSISLGLTIDNSIHFLSRFREESKFSGHIPQAVHLTYLGAGQAMVVSTLLQGSGLIVLLWSSFVPTQRFAELMGVTMAGTLIGDLILLPACVTLFWRDRRDSAAAPPSAAADSSDEVTAPAVVEHQ